MIRLLQVTLVLGKLALDPSGHIGRIPFLISSMAHRNYVFKTSLKWKEPKKKKKMEGAYRHFTQSTNFICKHRAFTEHST